MIASGHHMAINFVFQLHYFIEDSKRAPFCKETMCLLAKYLDQAPGKAVPVSHLTFCIAIGVCLISQYLSVLMAKVTTIITTFFSLGHGEESFTVGGLLINPIEASSEFGHIFSKNINTWSIYQLIIIRAY